MTASPTQPAGPAMHPSRSAPLCIACRYFETQKRGFYCSHPSAPVECIAGKPAARCEVMRQFDPDNRKFAGCGAKGALFAARDDLGQVGQGSGDHFQPAADVFFNPGAVDLERASNQVGAQQVRVGFAVPVTETAVDVDTARNQPAVDVR